MKMVIYRKLYIIIIFIVVVLLCGCTDLSQYVPLSEYNNKVVELEEANGKTEAKSIEILELQEEVNTLENNLDLTGIELEKYRSLVNNLNELLSNVYIGYAENENWISEDFTAFSLNYEDKVFLITAGHCIHYNFEGLDTGLYTTIKFKKNNGKWIYPELLTYENDYLNKNDYAIFYSKEIKEGLKIDYDNDYPQFLLGTINNNLNVIRENKNWGKDGECGSPTIDLEGEVTGIFIGYMTPIEVVIKAIDNLK